VRTLTLTERRRGTTPTFTLPWLSIALNPRYYRGENGGKRLSNVAVVEPLKRVGKLEKGRKFGQDVELKLNPSVRSFDLRIVVFVQEPGPGKVIGVALRKIAS
jgi:hypothetical protein